MQPISSIEEKLFFRAAVSISNGYYMGQTNTIDLFQYTSVATILDYISELEVTFTDRIPWDLIQKAIQEDLFPSFFTTKVLNLVRRKSGTSNVNFTNFASLFIAMRHFYFFAEGDFIEFEKFKEFLDSNKCPGRLKDYVSHTYVPTVEEINKASKSVLL